MSPRRPRRRARRRSRSRPVLLVAGALVVVALLIGGLTQVSSQSKVYDADSNHSLAAQGSVVADQSNATSAQVRDLVAAMQTQKRLVLQAGLDAAVQQTGTESAQAALAASSEPAGSLASEFATVFAERARSMSDLRAAVDGYLGMTPILANGSPGAAGAGVLTATVRLSPTQATNRIAAAGALLVRSDRLYRSVQSSLRAAVGHARLPASTWVSDPQEWGLGTVAAEVDLMATSTTLAPLHDVVMRTVRLDPPALPTPQGVPSGVSVLSPVSQIGVTVTVANDGTVDEANVPIRLTLADQTSGASTVQTVRVGVAFGRAVTLPTVTFGVKPGRNYVLTVAVIVPAGQTDAVGTAVQDFLEVAPAT
jgi:hypothetical protein